MSVSSEPDVDPAPLEYPSSVSSPPLLPDPTPWLFLLRPRSE